MDDIKKTTKLALQQQRAADAAAAMAEYQAAKVADQEKTARLRALRLAKEASDRSANAKSLSDKRKPRISTRQSLSR
jgi:hypothetical protein